MGTKNDYCNAHKRNIKSRSKVYNKWGLIRVKATYKPLDKKRHLQATCKPYWKLSILTKETKFFEWFLRKKGKIWWKFHKNDLKNEYSQIYWIKILFSKCSQRKKSACKIGTFKRFVLLEFNCSWRFTCNIIHYSVYPTNFVYNTWHNFI